MDQQRGPGGLRGPFDQVPPTLPSSTRAAQLFSPRGGLQPGSAGRPGRTDLPTLQHSRQAPGRGRRTAQLMCAWCLGHVPRAVGRTAARAGRPRRASGSGREKGFKAPADLGLLYFSPLTHPRSLANARADHARPRARPAEHPLRWIDGSYHAKTTQKQPRPRRAALSLRPVAGLRSHLRSRRCSPPRLGRV